MKINLTQKIKNIYKVAENNPRFAEIVEKHKSWLITKYELSFEYDRIYAESWKKDVLSINEWENENKPKQSICNGS